MKIDEFVDSLKRDKARGNLAPHQIILLISFSRLIRKTNDNHFDLFELIQTFDFVWQEKKDSFKSKNKNLGLPLRALINKGYVDVELNDDINDFRNKSELIEKIKSIKISSLLKSHLKEEYSENYLNSRITK